MTIGRYNCDVHTKREREGGGNVYTVVSSLHLYRSPVKRRETNSANGKR